MATMESQLARLAVLAPILESHDPVVWTQLQHGLDPPELAIVYIIGQLLLSW